MGNSERYLLNDQTLHVHQQGDLGWAVWLNIEDIDYSGLCIATGGTRNDAVGAAVRQLEGLVEVLQRPPVREFQLDGCNTHREVGMSGMVCPVCGKESLSPISGTFETGVVAPDGGKEYTYQQGYQCSKCGAFTDDEELDRLEASDERETNPV